MGIIYFWDEGDWGGEWGFGVGMGMGIGWGLVLLG